MTVIPAENTSWAIEVMIDKAVPIRLAVDTELLIGRIDPSETVFAGFDLTPFEGMEKGVSRRHAAIRREGDKLMVVDFNSGNGTFVDGVRLQPDKPARLTDGAKLQFG